MPVNVIYLSHGGRKFYDQARFSILTLLHLLIEAGRTDIRIAVYTDAPASVPQHDLVTCIALTPEQLTEYRGRFNYVHRIKIKVLQHAAEHFGTALLYVDCDTRWRTLPDAIFEKLGHSDTVCMHVDEGRIGEHFFPGYFNALKRLRAHLRSRLGIRLPESGVTMWNAGAVGVPAGAEHFFANALALNDYLFTRLAPRNWVEQLAWSLAAANAYEVAALGDSVHHYWNYSYEAPLYLEEVFAGMDACWGIEQQAEYCARYDWNDARLKELQAAPEHKRRRRFKKWRTSIEKRKTHLRIAFARLLTLGRI